MSLSTLFYSNLAIPPSCFFLLKRRQSIQENFDRRGNRRDRDKTRLEEGHEDYVPGERKRAPKCDPCRHRLHHRREAAPCVHEGGERPRRDTKDLPRGGINRLHGALDDVGWQELDDSYKQCDSSCL